MKLIKKNKKDKDCGVVAAFNAASWCDRYRSYEDVERIAVYWGYEKNSGIYPWQLHNLMKALGIPVKKISTTLEEMQSELYLGKFFVLFYCPTGCPEGHVISIFMDGKGHIRVINPDDSRATWNDLAADIYSNGMVELHVYELPNRELARKHDVA